MIPGLVCAHRFIGGSGASSIDLSGQGNDLSVVNATWEDAGLQFDANGEYAALDNSGQGVINSTAGTIVIKTKSLSAFTDGVGRWLFGSYAASTEGNFTILKQDNNYLYFLMEDSAGLHYVNLNSAGIPSWLTGTQLAFLWDRNNVIANSDKIVINVDGVHKVPSVASGETSWNSFTVLPSLYVGNNAADITNYANSVIERIDIFNRVLSVAELLGIKNNPESVYQGATKQYYQPILY